MLMYFKKARRRNNVFFILFSLPNHPVSLRLLGVPDRLEKSKVKIKWCIADCYHISLELIISNTESDLSEMEESKAPIIHHFSDIPSNENSPSCDHSPYPPPA